MKQRKFIQLSIALLMLGCLMNQSPVPQAQSGKPADWLTDGGDIERTAWQKNENLLSTASVKNMKLLWKTRLDNEPRQMHNLLPALIASNVTTASGPKQIVLVTGVSDNLYALDAETGAQLWELHFKSNWTPPVGGRGPGILCPGGITATSVIGPGKAPGKYIVYTAAWDGTLARADLATGKGVPPSARFSPAAG